MSTAISVLGGVGLFLIGMTVMTEGLKALAGSALRTVLGKAAATSTTPPGWGRQQVGIDFETVHGGLDDARAGQLCAEAMRSAGFVAGEVAARHDIIQSARAAPALPDAASNPATVSTVEALVRLERRAPHSWRKCSVVTVARPWARSQTEYCPPMQRSFESKL